MSSCSSYGGHSAVTVRIWLIHSVLSTAPLPFQDVSPSSSSSPTPFSHRRRLLKADASSIVLMFVRPVADAAPSTAPLIVGSIFSFAYLASLFQKLQPPTSWRV